MAAAFAAAFALTAGRAPGRAAQAVSFTRDVLPILSNRCLKCHGATIQLSGLDLRTRAGMLAGGKHGPGVVPGNAEGSRLFRLVSGQEKPSMPFDGELGPAEIAVLRDWINQGAVWEGSEIAQPAGAAAVAIPGLEEKEIPAEAREYWAFRPPRRPPVPRVKDADWARHPVDAFLAHGLEEKGLAPAPPADRATLARRAYLDLLGLPPSPEEVAAFVADASADAWEKLIERLLASPHYGERWGRHWLDVARYADSSGFEHDRDRPTAWRYRDYVIQSFNRDTPYNVFIAEQLAGDELDWVTFDSRTATGFLRAGPRVEFREKDNPQYRFDYLDDMIATTAQGLLGLTVQCARCHDHKFDPILQKDYYRLQADFFPAVEVNHYLASEAEVRKFLQAREEIDSKIKALRDQIAEIEGPYREKAFIAEVLHRFPEDAAVAMKTPEAARTPGQKLLVSQLLGAVGVPGAALERALSPEDRARRGALASEVKRLEASRPKEPPSAVGITDGDYRFAPDSYGDEPAPGKARKSDPSLRGSYLHKGPEPYRPPPSYLLIRGEMDSRGPLMEPGFLAVLTQGKPPTAVPPADGCTSGRRRALAEWIASGENPLTARVMVNRIWHHHFGRGIVASLNNFGKMGERPTHPELLDWLAAEFVARGWSIKQMHRLVMTSRAYRMASSFESAADQKIDPDNLLLWKFRIQRLDAEALRDSILAVSGALNREVGGPPVFPPLDPSVLASMRNGIWKKEEDGPAVWRRSVYVYRKRGLPFPMFEVFDLPDQNVTCPKRYVSTVPTQALTLLNDTFVLAQARNFAERIAREAGTESDRQVTRAYRLALARDPSEEERRVTLEFLAQPGRGLADLAHVLLNLNEFVYLR
ncbi:MAG: hypothetical protein DMG07_01890 [Acidobacteria bacterium]|nr:MAG: hypothetical protein DMG07_01890 [Acidobacteriota bacterium]